MQMANVFEEPAADYTVLCNAWSQHSLWPVTIAVPDGWTVVHGPGPRPDCLAYVRQHWVDLRGSDLVEFVAVVPATGPAANSTGSHRVTA
jgi:MbtH protein